MDFFHTSNMRQKALAQSLRMFNIIGHFMAENFTGRTHTDNLMGSQGARTHTTLMATAVHLRFQTNTRLARNVESTNAFWAINLVARKRHQVNLQLFHIDRQTSQTLGSIHMEDNFAGTG